MRIRTQERLSLGVLLVCTAVASVTMGWLMIQMMEYVQAQGPVGVRCWVMGFLFGAFGAVVSLGGTRSRK